MDYEQKPYYFSFRDAWMYNKRIAKEQNALGEKILCTL